MRAFVFLTLALIAVLTTMASGEIYYGNSTSYNAVNTSMNNLSQMNIVDALSASGNFKILVQDLRTTGLDGPLSNSGPYTIFAPTDAAFSKVPNSTLSVLTANKTILSNVLAYHVIPNDFRSINIRNDTSVLSLQGSMLNFSVLNGVPMVDNARVVQSDILVKNGIIHVIDSVLIPPSNTLTRSPALMPVNPVNNTFQSVVPGSANVTTNATTSPGNQTAPSATPGFEAIFVMTGILASAYLLGRKR